MTGSRDRTRQLIEMQRNVNVDEAEIRLVTAQVVPVYKTQPGVQQPVLHPPPVAYRESFMPSSIAHRHDPETLFSDANIHLSPEPPGTKPWLQRRTISRGRWHLRSFYVNGILHSQGDGGCQGGVGAFHLNVPWLIACYNCRPQTITIAGATSKFELRFH